jgi:hypothetical protein
MTNWTIWKKICQNLTGLSNGSGPGSDPPGIIIPDPDSQH